MVRESGISATRPIFPSYLLPSIKLPFRRRGSASSASSAPSSVSPTSTTASPATTPGNSPPTPNESFLGKAKKRLSKVAPDTLRCLSCSSDLGLASQIISKGFTGRHGRAFLVAPPFDTEESELLNIRVGRSENRQLVTGWHTVADITCGTCSSKLGWKYVDAKESSQKYKVGKFILEVERVMTHCTWEDASVPEMDDPEEISVSNKEGQKREEVVFDSEDEDECEDVFLGLWNAEDVAERRSNMIQRRGTAS